MENLVLIVIVIVVLLLLSSSSYLMGGSESSLSETSLPTDTATSETALEKLIVSDKERLSEQDQEKKKRDLEEREAQKRRDQEEFDERLRRDLEEQQRKLREDREAKELERKEAERKQKEEDDRLKAEEAERIRERRTPLSCNVKNSTPWNDEGGGNAIYLDRHNVNCSGKPLSRLQLLRKGDGNYHYEFTCCSGGKFNTPQTKETPLNDEGGGNAVYLDRHNINCGENAVITQLHLVREPPVGGRYQYKYTCSPAISRLTCRQTTTPWNLEGGGNAVYLDRHNIVCNSDEALSRLQLLRKGDGNYRYEYTCCKVDSTG